MEGMSACREKVKYHTHTPGRGQGMKPDKCTHTLEIQPEPGDLRKVDSLLLCDPARLSVRPLVGHALPQESLAHHVRLDRVVKVAHVCNRIYGYGVLRPWPADASGLAADGSAHKLHRTTEAELRSGQT